MQSGLYTEGAYGDCGLQAFDMAEALTENPHYVVYNGSVGAMTDDNAIRAEVGKKIRVFVGNGDPNLVPAGGSAIVEFKVDASGTYIVVDHSIFRAFNSVRSNIQNNGKKSTRAFKHYHSVE